MPGQSLLELFGRARCQKIHRHRIFSLDQRDFKAFIKRVNGIQKIISNQQDTLNVVPVTLSQRRYEVAFGSIPIGMQPSFELINHDQQLSRSQILTGSSSPVFQVFDQLQIG